MTNTTDNQNSTIDTVHDDELSNNGAVSVVDLWKRTPYLRWAFIISAIVHLGIVIPIILFAQSSDDFELDAHWISQFENMVAIGHGRDLGTWAENADYVQLPTPDTENVLPEDNQTPPGGSNDIPDAIADKAIADDVVSDNASADAVPPTQNQALQNQELEGASQPGTASPRAKTTRENRPRKTQSRATHSTTKAPPAKASADTTNTLPGLDIKGPTELPNLKQYAPGNARVTALVRMDRLRDSQFELAAKKLVELVPDYRILLESTGLDPIRNMDTLFMASANPNYLHETFLAVRHKYADDELIDILGRRFAQPMEWESYNNYKVRNLVPANARYQDPRQILLARPGLAVVSKSEWLASLTGRLPEVSALSQGDIHTLLDGLLQIENAANRDDILMLMSVQGMYLALPGIGRLPQFQAARLQLSDAQAPKLDIDLHFRNADEARRFASECPTMASQLIAKIPFARTLGLAALIERIKCKADAHYVVVQAAYSAQELAQVLQLAMPFIPRPPALRGLPPAPTPPGDEG